MIEIEVLKKMGPYKKGQIIKLESDIEGTPLDRYWRARLKDSKIDNCCRIKPKQSSTKRKSNKESEKK